MTFLSAGDDRPLGWAERIRGPETGLLFVVQGNIADSICLNHIRVFFGSGRVAVRLRSECLVSKLLKSSEMAGLEPTSGARPASHSITAWEARSRSPDLAL